MNADTIVKSVTAVTSKWAKQRKAEERGSRSKAGRHHTLTQRSTRITIREVAFDVMEDAYLNASANRKYPALARQIMYAARPEILRRTGESKLDSQYFTQTLLPDYIEEYGCSDWDVAFDARGHLYEPHTKKEVALGTLEVRRYLHNVDWSGGTGDNHPGSDFDDNDRFPTAGPDNRFGAVVFIEKEGFFPLFRAAKLAERYDIAIMSTKGLSVTAARLLVDKVCGGHRVPLLVLHDFDKAGFSILGTLQGDTRRYHFVNDVEVIDLGLRLSDVQEQGLSSEGVDYSSNPCRNLRKNGATEKEIEFLYGNGYGGERVELNAFTSDALIKWLESKLEQHGIKKLVPNAAVLGSAFRRAFEIATVRDQIAKITVRARKKALEADLPDGLREKIEKQLEKNPAMPWDLVVAEIATAEHFAESA